MPMENLGVELPLENVHISDEFWSNRMDAVKTGALPAIYDQMKKTGRWDCLKLEWKPGMLNKPHRFWDSDVAKWLEAACYTLIYEPDPSLATLVEEAVDLIRGAQQEDGYINTYYTVVEPGKRWTNVAWSHEMYDAGHLLEAALAHRIYSGSNRLLDPILKYVKHIRSVFGLKPGQKAGYPGHQELELALLKTYECLVKLPSASGEFEVSMLLDLADYFLEERGRIRSEGHYFDVEAHARGEKEANAGPAPMGEPRFSYYQADRVIREMKDVNGHAVRVMYWLTAVAHLARLKKDTSLLHAAERLWTSTTERKMYLSGGLGAIGDWEGFGDDYYLPNESGYVETCAAIGLVLFAHQMLLLNPGEAKHAHVMERALYNGVLVGMSLNGKSFFYENPLATIGKKRNRSEWFDVSCCPPNVARLLGSLHKYIYTYTPNDNTLHVHLYMSSESSTVLASGMQVTIIQEREGPWAGEVKFRIHGSGTSGIKLALRKPEGISNFEITSETHPHIFTEEAGTDIIILYVPARLSSFSFTVGFDFVIRKIQPHPLNLDNYHHIALAYGPFIYCAESIDNPHIMDMRAIRLLAEAPVHEVHDSQNFAIWGLKDVSLLRMPAKVLGGAGHSGTARDTQITLVPLFTWANRGQSDLRVWLPLEQP